MLKIEFALLLYHNQVNIVIVNLVTFGGSILDSIISTQSINKFALHCNSRLMHKDIYLLLFLRIEIKSSLSR